MNFSRNIPVEAIKMSLNGHKTYSSDESSDMICEKTITAKVIGVMQKVTAAKITIQSVVFMVLLFINLSSGLIMRHRSLTKKAEPQPTRNMACRNAQSQTQSGIGCWLRRLVRRHVAHIINLI